MAYKFKVGPHYKQKLSTQSIMFHLTIGLLIVYAFGLYKAATLGTAYVINAVVLMVTSVAVALITEAIWAKATKKNIKDYISTSFGWITAIILTLMVPVNTEPYALGVATFIAIFFGKLVFGGFGQNVFNPAAVGRAVIFASFAGSISADLVTTATPTATIASAGWMMTAENFTTFLNDFGGLGNLFFGTYNGAIGETSSLLILLVGVYLAFKEVIDYRVPVTYLLTIFLSALVIGASHGLGLSYALFHVFTGGAVFGAVFMLTDPVTNPNTRVGRMVFAIVAAFFTMLIRLCANLPEGVLYSILLANILTPVIDKVFDGKQTTYEKRNTKILIGSAIVGVVAISCLGFTLNSDKGYTSIIKPEKPEVELNLTDGTFEGTGKGLMGDIKVSVVVSGGKITEIKVLEHSETPGVSDPAFEKVPAAIIDAQSTSVDAISGCTFSSNGIMEAVTNAVNGGSSTTPTEPTEPTEPLTLTDGTFEGVGKGLMSDIKVSVVVADGKITEINVLEHGETAGVSDPAFNTVPQAIIDAQSTSVDVASGATFSSNGIMEAVKNALSSTETATPSETETPVETPTETPSETTTYVDGEYEGTGKGLMGDIKVNVIVKDGKIAEVVVLEHGETAGVSDPAFNTIPQAIVDAQSTSVDVASGATFSSNGIMEAASNALAAAK